MTLPRVRLSLFAKLGLIAFATVVVIVWIVAGTIGELFRKGQEQGLERKIVGYVRFIGDEVFRNPTPERIDEIAERLGVGIRYEGPGLSYATEEMPGIEEILSRGEVHHGRHGWHGGGRRRHMPPDIVPAFYEGRFFVLHERSQQQLAISVEGGFDRVFDRVPFLAAGALALIAAVLGCAYLLIRRLLFPLRELERNQAALARGEWPEEMKAVGTDEVGRLVDGFNHMQRRIRSTLDAKERLLADISHEFRTPLTRMKVAVEMMDDPKASRRLSADIAELDALTGEILEGARLKAGAATLEKERCTLAELIEGALAGYGGEERKCMRFVDETRGIKVDADVRRVRRALRNVIDNSLKHSEPAEGSIRIRAYADQGSAAVEVADRGPGVPEEEAERLFDSFYRTDRSRSRETGGYGLGLRMCKAIVEAHGGSVRARSGQGQGLTVTLTLPAAQEATAGI